MTEREALKVALEALNHYEKAGLATVKTIDAITAIKEVLAQKEHEPHSWYSKQEDEWMTHKTRKEHERLNSYTHKVGKFDLALYTTPPQRTWVGLMDDEIKEASLKAGMQEHYMGFHSGFIRFAQAIEAKLKEKNT